MKVIQEGQTLSKVIVGVIVGFGLWAMLGAPFPDFSPEEPPRPAVTDFLPTQEDCNRNPELMGC